MYKNLVVFLFFFVPLFATSQILPKEGSKLNYRLVGFLFMKENKATKYKIQIATGNLTDTAAFRKNIINTIPTTETKVMVELPSFGTQYTWRVKYTSNDKEVESPLHHFSTVVSDRVDTTKNRLRILKPAANKDYNNMYIATDGGGVIYDIHGAPMAYIPEVNGLGGYVIGTSFTPEGTMTFNFTRYAYEIKLNGEILWSTPPHNPVAGEGIADVYHHETYKMANGHYMVMGMEFIPSLPVTSGDSSYILFSNNPNEGPPYKPGRYGTLIEFDKKGNVVWSWKDTKHLVGSDFDYFTSPNDTNLRFDPHSNSFCFDEKNKVIYMSYRNLNRITKIDYNTGKVLNIYGERYKPGQTSYGRGLFCNPHGVKRSMDGYIYFYNNNSCRNTDSLPSVIMFKEPANDRDSLKVIWEYTCTMEPGYSKKFGSGGSAIEMPDRSLFVCMGNDYSKIFIVSRDKKELWAALPERHIDTDNIWLGNRQYRSIFLDRQELERLIWNAETGN